MGQTGTFMTNRPCQALENSVSWHAKPKADHLSAKDENGLTSHRAHLRELSGLYTSQQISNAGRIYLKSGLEHIQGAIPTILVTSIEHELELRYVKRQVDPSWCAFHRPPPDRDWPIRTPSRLFCKVLCSSPSTLC